MWGLGFGRTLPAFLSPNILERGSSTLSGIHPFLENYWYLWRSNPNKGFNRSLENQRSRKCMSQTPHDCSSRDSKGIASPLISRFSLFLMTVHIKLLPWIDISQKFTAQVFRDCAPCSKKRKTLFALNGQLVIVRHWFMSTGRDAFLLSCFAFEFLTFVTLHKRSRQLSFYAFERSLYTAIKIVRIWKSVTGRSYIQRDFKKLDDLSRKILNLKELFFPSERFEVSTTCRVRLL